MYFQAKIQAIQKPGCAIANNCVLRKYAFVGGLTTQQIADLKFITYSDTLGKDGDGSTPLVGTVNMEAYAKWLKENYQLSIGTTP
ncbi:MAG: hypothetical protein KAY21_07170 [Limnohabitans sp.]|nr:hypothetical protein [Limnohabitans sp.]